MVFGAINWGAGICALICLIAVVFFLLYLVLRIARGRPVSIKEIFDIIFRWNSIWC